METATSPSHRRAWIEIVDQSRCLRACGVALPSESASKRLPSHHIQSSPLFKGAVLLCLCKRNAFDSAYAINLPLSAASFVVICALTCSFVGLADPFGCLRRDSVTYYLHAGQTHVLRRNNVSRLYAIDPGGRSPHCRPPDQSPVFGPLCSVWPVVPYIIRTIKSTTGQPSASIKIVGLFLSAVVLIGGFFLSSSAVLPSDPFQMSKCPAAVHPEL